MTEIIIGSVSLNRIKLHNDTLKDWIEWIDNINKNRYIITWFFHISVLKDLEDTLIETKQNIIRLLNDKNIKIKFIHGDKHKNYINAYKELSHEINSHVKMCLTEPLIMWIEDDWKLLLDSIIPLESLIDTCISNYAFINLCNISKNAIHSISPCIIKYNVWYKLHYIPLKDENRKVSPEYSMGAYYLNYIGKYEDIHNCSILNKMTSCRFIKKYPGDYYSMWENHFSMYKDKNYIDKNNFKSFFRNNLVFYRIIPSFCNNNYEYGKEYMINHYNKYIQTKINMWKNGEPLNPIMEDDSDDSSIDSCDLFK
tara:strand:+ start:2784 stop:3716 length:933 start_codon:yes stop_codon:yes gene_type:complete